MGQIENGHQLETAAATTDPAQTAAGAVTMAWVADVLIVVVVAMVLAAVMTVAIRATRMDGTSGRTVEGGVTAAINGSKTSTLHPTSSSRVPRGLTIISGVVGREGGG